MMKRAFTALVAAALSLCLLPAAAQTPSAATGCLRLGQIDGFSAIQGNDRAFVVTDRLHRRFKINLMFRCGGLDFNNAVRFQTLEQGRLACVSRGDTVISRDITSVANPRCPISSIETYTPAMEAADKAAAKAH
jgi:hypothetical protein